MSGKEGDRQTPSMFIDLRTSVSPRSEPRPFEFDPICGSRLPVLYRVNGYSDGHRTFFFCSIACRRFFLEHSQLQASARQPVDERGQGESSRSSRAQP
jgi:YHS domain-containing protein